ncbi:hypothetical protein PPL_11539 [Heterostelium album PN500]|uniref:Uncharacterized protein n=1 Tax=Heterostelium pallidum (strain ATCC 26659 / Pp 5 / PN500) TaxID=670386 RepID=D3BVE8_HETP5|nr:hypothetical protein PPL_11539 [Heterostelium album PN500]EFA74571.1 hypothetical protein PPL_11539 [Heterostelium album PN500]|eukprot:XP_020426705.1 hypothetical protein PPL_11539 [Heterostelium album PN500]
MSVRIQLYTNISSRCCIFVVIPTLSSSFCCNSAATYINYQNNNKHAIDSDDIVLCAIHSTTTLFDLSFNNLQ